MKKQLVFLLLFLPLIFAFSSTTLAADQNAHAAHPVCGSACTHDGVDSHEDVEWIMLTKSNLSQYKYQTTGLKSGNYYLGEDITLPYNLTLNGVSVNLCLNGKTLTAYTGSTSSSAITVSGDGQLTLTDCSSTVTEGYIRSMLWTKGQSSSSYDIKMNLTGGVITGGKCKYGGALHIVSGTVHMYGGNIAGNECYSSDRYAHAGGGVYNEGAFHLYGGTICGNRINTWDGGSSTTFYYGAGGGIRSTGTLTMSGGTICYNYGDDSGSGGGIFNSGDFQMSGGSIYKNQRVMSGGGVSNSGTFTMSGGHSSDNTSRYDGGGIRNSGTCTLNSGTISNNISLDNGDGGGVYNTGTFIMNSGSISNNLAANSGNGGGVYNAGTFQMHDGKITGNTARTTSYSFAHGGGVSNSNNGSFVMTGGEISGNTVKHDSTSTGTALGGGIYNYGALTLTGGKICDNSVILTKESGSSALGGGIYVNASKYYVGTIHVSGAPEITGNTCDGISNNIYLLQEGAVTVGTDTDEDGVMEALTDGAVLYVTPGIAPTDEIPFIITTEATADYSPYFSADDRNYQAITSGADDQQVVQMIIHIDHIYDHETVDEAFLASAATCQNPAVYYKSCFCGAIGDESFEYGSTVDHCFTTYHSNNDATCTMDGTKTAQCDYEGCTETNTQTDEGSALGHSFTTYISNNNATCTADGTKTAQCDHAGCKETDTQVDTNSTRGHSFTIYVSNNDATCMTDGTETAVCDYVGCNETDTRTDKDSKLAHSFSIYSSNNDATCMADGTESAVCNREGCEETDTRTDAGSKLDHSFTIYSSNNDATCMADGTESAVCDYEGCSETDIRTDVDSKTAHVYGAWLPVLDATYIEAGEEKRVCSQEGCEAFETRIIPATGPELLENVTVVYDQDAGTLILLNVPQKLTVIFALYDDNQMIECSLRYDTANTVSYVLPNGYEKRIGKVFFLTQTWQPIGESTVVVF